MHIYIYIYIYICMHGLCVAEYLLACKYTGWALGGKQRPPEGGILKTTRFRSELDCVYWVFAPAKGSQWQNNRVCHDYER